ncbi:PadR family transcriptional regulator [Cohnella yongneupensis]|uniref:Helix-turn-helix transcriptional regulator n=1 Tax=Cohnella yongneupensis TaxID=425006 RepID=A0ABW0QU70_9BACL
MSMKLFILGLLMEKDQHPYEIRQTIKQRNWNISFKLRDGSLYYAVDQLRNDGLIEAIEVIPVPGDSRPDKTVYRITEQGKAEFMDLMVHQMEQQSYPQHPIFAALPFIQYADARTVEALVEKHLEACACRIERLQTVLDVKRSLLPSGATHLIEGMKTFSVAERLWLENLLRDAKSDRLNAGSGIDCQGGSPEPD